MKRKLIFALFWLSISPAFAEYRVTREFAMSEEKNQCGIFWSLRETPPKNSPLWDEASPPRDVILGEIPFQWKVYDPEAVLILETPYGTCRGSADSSPPERERFARECCQKLEFDYVDYLEVPHTTTDIIRFNESGWSCVPEIGNDAGILINAKEKTCSSLIDFSLEKEDQIAYPQENKCFLTDKNWKEHKESSFTTVMKTPFGECSHFLERAYPHQYCCEELGFKYVGKDLTTNVFRDLQNHWVHSSAKKLIERGIIEQKEYFFPEHFITRSEALKIALLLRGSKIPKNLKTPPFVDTPLENWDTPYITVGSQEGIVSGFSENAFFPNNHLTRAEALKILAKASSSDTSSFRRNFAFYDVPVLSWQAEFVAWAKERSIASGFSDGYFYPNNTVTRAEFAKMAVVSFGL